MEPDKEFELRRILFAILTFVSWALGILNAFLFYNWRLDPAWFYTSILLPTSAVLAQNAWSLFLVSRPYNGHIFDIWWRQTHRDAPRKRIVLLFMTLFGYLNLHHDMRNKRHEYDASLLTLTTWHACIHWIPSFVYQIYISNNVGYCHAFQLVYILLLGICIAVFLSLVLHRYTQYHIPLLLAWMCVRLMVNVFPVSVFMALRGTSDKTKRIYAWLGNGAILIFVAHSLLLIFAKRISTTQFAKVRACCGRGDGEDNRKSLLVDSRWRLGSILIFVSSVLCFVVIAATMGRFIDKASRNDTIKGGVYNLDDHEMCHGMLTALKNHNCTRLRSEFTNFPDCIGSPALISMCPHYPAWWVESVAFHSPASAYVFAGLMIFFALITSEFFLAACLMICFKGSDKKLKKRAVLGGRKPAVRSTIEETSMVAAAAAPPNGVAPDEARGTRHTDLDEEIALVKYESEFLSFAKGDSVKILDRTTENERLWQVEFNGSQGFVHRGFFRDVSGFVSERCRSLYDFDPDFDMETSSGEELLLNLDDAVLVLEKPEGSDWWFAQINDKYGWVPKNYLEKTTSYD